MRRLTLALSLLTVVLAPSALRADSVPYGSPGTKITTYVQLYAASTGTLSLTFVRSDDTGYIDWLTFTDVTQGTTSAPFFYNGGSTKSSAGDVMTFAVNQGDLLNFTVYIGFPGLDPQNYIPTLNADKSPHGYIANFVGGPIFPLSYNYPAGLYVGLEDLTVPFSNLDYADEGFILNYATTVVPVPEPTTISLIATGIIGAVGVLRRKTLHELTIALKSERG